MARYRPVWTKIWKDQKVQKFTPEDKLLFVYLLTNELLNESGVYCITPKTVANETGLTEEGALKGLTRGLQGVAEYDLKENVVWVINFLNYQHNRSPNMIKSIQNDIKHIKSTLMTKFIKYYQIDINAIDLNLKPNPITNPKPKANPTPIPIPNPIGGLTSPLQAPSSEGEVEEARQAREQFLREHEELKAKGVL